MRHAVQRVRQRIFDGIEAQAAEPWRIVVNLWDAGRKVPWHDPDDPAGHITITSVTTRGAIIGRRDLTDGRVFLISALTLKQYANNACWRWIRAEDRHLR